MTSKIKSLGYTATDKVSCSTSIAIPSSATECYVVVYVAGTASGIAMTAIVPLHTGMALSIYGGSAGTASYFDATLSADQSFYVRNVIWYNQARTAESTYQLFYR